MSTPAPPTAPAPIIRPEHSAAFERAGDVIARGDAATALEGRLALARLQRAIEEVEHQERAARNGKVSALTPQDAAKYEAVVVDAGQFLLHARATVDRLKLAITEAVRHERELSTTERQERFRALVAQGDGCRSRCEAPRRALAELHGELDALAVEATSLKHQLVTQGSWPEAFDQLPWPGSREVAR